MIFARLPIVHVTISIDGQYLGSARRSSDNSNLFVLPWNASLYHDEKLHQILVQIKVNKLARESLFFSYNNYSKSG